MSDDRIRQGLDTYAEHLQRTGKLAPASEIRRRAARRRRRQATGTAFAAVLITAIGVGTVLTRGPDRPPSPGSPPTTAGSPPATTAVPSSVSPPPTVAPTATPSRRSTVTSDVSRLRQLGIDLETGVLIDVADDGMDRWMQVGADDTVDFTGTAKDESTRMVLRPAPVAARNMVMILVPARPGSCVADTPQEPLVLQPCRDGDPAQTWRVIPAGDSGQFELEGRYGILRVDGRLVAADQSGWTGLQTIPFTR